MAVGDDDRAIAAHLAGRERDLPVVRRKWADTRYFAAEADMRPHAEAVAVGFQMREDFAVGEKVRLVGRHREVGIAETVAARVDVEAAVGRRHLVVVLVAPHTADAGAGLEDLERHAAVLQRLRGYEPRRA